MAGLGPAIHVFRQIQQEKTWMVGTGPAMTTSADGSLSLRLGVSREHQLGLVIVRRYKKIYGELARSPYIPQGFVSQAAIRVLGGPDRRLVRREPLSSCLRRAAAW